MSLDLYSDELQRSNRAGGVASNVEPGLFEGFVRGTGMFAMKEFAKTARSVSMAGAAIPVAVDAITGGTTLQDKYFKSHEDTFGSAVKFWDPDPGTVGEAGQVAGALIGLLPQIIANPAAAVASQQLSSAEDLVTKPGVSANKAMAVGAAQALGLGVGIWAPPAIGNNLAQWVATGAGINWLQGVVTRGASSAILEGTEAAKEFPAFGLKEQALDILLGAAFGGAVKFNKGWRQEAVEAREAIEMAARRNFAPGTDPREAKLAPGAAAVREAMVAWGDQASPTQKAALATLRVAQHANVDSLPGRPTHPGAIDINRDRLSEAIDSLLKDKPLPPEGRTAAPPDVRPVPETPALRDLSDTALRPVGDVLPITQSMVPPRDWEIMTRLGLVQEGKVGDQTLQFVEPHALAAERAARADDDQTQPINDRIARVENQIQDAETVLEAARYSEPDKVGEIETKLDMLNERLASLKEERPDFEIDPERTTQAVETTRAMTDGVRETAGDDGIPPPPEVVEPIETVVERGLLEAGRSADEAKVGATIWRETFKSWSVATGLDPDALFHRYMKGITGQAQPAADALAQGPVRESPAARIEEYRPTLKKAKNGLPIFQNRHVALGQPKPAESKAPRGDRVVFMIFDMERGTPAKVGYVIADIDPATNTFLALRNIKIDDAVQNMGHGEKAVATMLAHNGDKPMEIVDITHAGEEGIGSKTDALPRWKKWGTVLRNYSTNPDIQMDGVLTKEAYLNARRYQQGRSGSGTQAAQADGQGSAGGARGDRGTARADADRAELARLNGTLFQGAKPTETPAFKAWFGDSKVVDADGNPQVVYHGTADNFDTFTFDHPNRKDQGWLGQGFYFSNQPDIANSYTNLKAGSSPNVMPVYLAIKNPYQANLKDKQALMLADGRGEKEAAQKWTDGLRDQGYDGVVLDYGMTDGTKEFVAFEPTQIKSAIGNRGTFDPNNPNILYQDSPWYYSALGRAIDNSPTKAADANGWKQWLKGLINKGTVKADEIKATELEEYLDATQGKITKEQLQTFMQEGGVRVEEVVLGNKQAPPRQAVRMETLSPEDQQGVAGYEYSNSQSWVIFDDAGIGHAYDAGTAEQAIEEFRRDMVDTHGSDQTSDARFEQFQLPGAKEGSYREIALVLPRQDFRQEKTENLRAEKQQLEDEVLAANADDDTTYQSERIAEINKEIRALRDQEHTDYRVPQGHSMGDKADTNRIAHIRFNERTGPNGERVLFIEEIQSDWAQQGKRDGFDNEAAFQRLIKERDAAPDDSPQQEELQRQIDAMASKGGKGVPSGPFVTKTEAWVALSMKRMIRYAAENGFDQIAWTTGAQQADRYDLSKQVQSLSYFKNKAGAYEIKVIPVGRGTEWQTVARDVPPEKLEDYVGKETAQKIIDGAGNKAKTGDTIMTGIDLKVGGEGMKGFYDKIVPTVAKDVLKKLGGGKVEQVELEMPKGKPTQYADYAAWQAAESGYSTQQAITITPEMRAKVMEGQALFQPAYHASPHTFDQFSLQHIGKGEGAQVYGWGLYFATNTKVRDWYYDNFMRRAEQEATTTVVDTSILEKYLQETPEADPGMVGDYVDERMRGKSPAAATLEVGSAWLDREGPSTVLDNWRAIAEKVETLGVHTIGPNDDPAYKTPTGEIVHVRMTGEAKAKAGAIGQLLHEGYQRAAQTYDSLLRAAQDHADATKKANDRQRDEVEYDLSMTVTAVDGGPSKWGSVDPSARSWYIRMADDGRRDPQKDARRGLLLSEQSAITAEEAIAQYHADLRRALKVYDDVDANALDRVTEMKRARELLDEYVEPAGIEQYMGKTDMFVPNNRSDGNALGTTYASQFMLDDNNASVLTIWYDEAMKTWTGSVTGRGASERPGKKLIDLRFPKDTPQQQVAEEMASNLVRARRDIEKVQPQIKKPRKYEVELTPKPEDYLDWDVEIKDMSKPVREALDALYSGNMGEDITGREVYKGLVDQMREIKDGNDDDWLWVATVGEGKDYSNMSPEEMASRLLLGAGIPGIRYLDGSSRRRGQGNHNIVIFDDSLVTIKSMEQDRQRGFLNIGPDRKMTIGLLAADKSTFQHESAHFFLEVMDDLAKDHPALEADMQVLFKEWGVTREQWDSMTLDDRRDYHEQFARGFEAYLMTNRAPSDALRDAFRKFRDWLIAIYKSASNLNVKVSAEVRQLMDRMLSAEQREKATTQAATDGSPPPPPPEASPGTGGMFDDLAAERPPFEARTIEDQDVREILRTMAENETGWAQIGGRNLGGELGKPNFSTWIPKADWWLDRPDNIKKLKEPEYYAAVAKALVGDKLKPIEQRAVDFMLAKANERLKFDYEHGPGEADALTRDLIEADLEPTMKNLVDADAVAIAHQINPAEVERLAMEHQDDDAAFVAEIARMIDEHQNSQTSAGRDEGKSAPAEQARATDGTGEAPDPLSLEADRIAGELGDQPMEITMPDGSTRTMTAAQYLADVRESAAMAREDIALINEAAQCLLGAV